MERHHPRTIAPTPVCRELPSRCNSDEMVGFGGGDALRRATRFGPSKSDQGCANSSTSASVDQGLSDFSAPLNDQLRSIRRKLWILNATLDSLLAKVELGYHPSAYADRQRRARPVSAYIRSSRQGWARARAHEDFRVLASQMEVCAAPARAVRAERHAAVAMNNASASLSQALEAALQYACAAPKLTGPARTSSVPQLRGLGLEPISGRNSQ